MLSFSCIIFKSEDNRILLQHRAEDTRHNPNLWGFFGGHIEDGETPEEAVVRETKEELSINLKDYIFYKKYSYLNQEGKPREKNIFIAPLSYPIEELKQKQQEGQDLGLFSFEEIKELEIIPHDFEVIKDVFNI